MFPGAPKEVYNRPDGAIDILIGSAYRNLQPYGGEGSFTVGRLRLVHSMFGCGFILTGTHNSIVTWENTISRHARTLAKYAVVQPGENVAAPTVSCNRAVMGLRIPEFLRQRNWESRQPDPVRNVEDVGIVRIEQRPYLGKRNLWLKGSKT